MATMNILGITMYASLNSDFHSVSKLYLEGPAIPSHTHSLSEAYSLLRGPQEHASCMSHTKALKKVPCESVGATICQGGISSPRGSYSGKNIGHIYPAGECSEHWLVGRLRDHADQKKTWAHDLSKDVHMFRATKGSLEISPLSFGYGVLWSMVAKKCGKCYRGIFAAADCFMAMWRRDEARRGRLRHVAANTKSGGKGK